MTYLQYKEMFGFVTTIPSFLSRIGCGGNYAGTVVAVVVVSVCEEPEFAVTQARVFENRARIIALSKAWRTETMGA